MSKETEQSKRNESHQSSPQAFGSRLASYPPLDRWDDWVEYDARSWPKKVERHYSLVPTTCFNCEAACGLLAYIDQATGEIQKLEGNPLHPGSRGRNCAKGPATINQIHDPERILFPLKRVGARGEGQWERTTWDEVLDTFAAKIRSALIENRRDEVVYHVSRPGHDGYIDQCSKPGALMGTTRIQTSARRVPASDMLSGKAPTCPSPDYANAAFICCSALTLRPVTTSILTRSGSSRQNGRCKDRGDRPAPVEHRIGRALPVVSVARHRGGAAAGDGRGRREGRHIRSRVRSPLGELGKNSCGKNGPRFPALSNRSSVRSRNSIPSTRPSTPQKSAVSKPKQSSRSLARSPARVPDSRLMSGVARLPAISADGKWLARSTF